VRTNTVDGPIRTTAKASNRVATPESPRSVGWIIAASCFAFAVIQLDVTIVNVALSRISQDLGATVTELQWVVDAYTIGFAALLLSAGVVGDRLGSKRVFIAGLVGFAAASLACGLAPGPGFLNATRAIQGIGAALLVPSSLAILNHACAHDPRLRARAIGIWTAAGGVAIAAGPMVGGFLLTVLGWRSIFLVNIPICAVGLALTLRFVPSAQWENREQRTLDLAGQSLAIIALTALIGAVIEARPLGPTHPMVMAAGLLAVGVGAAFIAVEARSASPMLPLQLFRRPGFSPAIVFGVFVNCTYYGIIFVISLYLQTAMGYSTVQAGLAFLPLTGTFIASNIASGWMAGRVGSRLPMILGALIGALGYGLLVRLGSRSNFFDMLPGFVLIPAGIGLAVPAMTTAILSSVDRARSGTASAVLNAARQVGGAIGVAAFGALVTGVTPEQITSGLNIAAWIATALLIIAALIALSVHPE
ncbi:MAG TPA: MFS transporter, partial [Chthoniobacterales bacterium]|nr:MFS transporter [Chthoniobacterales bacterium]